MFKCLRYESGICGQNIDNAKKGASINRPGSVRVPGIYEGKPTANPSRSWKQQKNRIKSLVTVSLSYFEK